MSIINKLEKINLENNSCYTNIIEEFKLSEEKNLVNNFEKFLELDKPSNVLILYAILKFPKLALLLKLKKWKISEQLANDIVRMKPENIKHIPHQSEEIQMIAVNLNPRTIKYINNPTVDVQMYVLNKNYYLVKDIHNLHDRAAKFVAFHHPEMLEFIEEQTPEICKIAISSSYHSTKYVKNKTSELQIFALSVCLFSVYYFKDILTDEAFEFMKDKIKNNEIYYSPHSTIEFLNTILGDRKIEE